MPYNLLNRSYFNFFGNFKVKNLALELHEKASFEVIFEGTVLNVSEHYFADLRIFKVQFPDNRKPLALTVATGMNKKFWTSVPQGRQAEAEKIGSLIALYFKSG
jgi:predicted DNA-binding protein (MmcQ/YjbR family)